MKPADVPRRLHPFGFALAPVLSMGAANVLHIEVRELVAPCLAVLAATAVVLGGLWLLRRDYARSAALTSLLLVVFFVYGHAVDLVWELGVFASPGWLYAVSGPAAVSILLVAGAMLWRTSRSLELLSSALGVASLVFLAIPLWTLLSAAEIGASRRLFQAGSPAASPSAPVGEERPDLPDIYYIVTDEYARADVLEEFFGYDNSDFLRQLRERGFYVAERSFSNYALTFLSLASSLEMRFVNEEARRHYEARRRSRLAFYRLIRAPRVARFLRERGYRYVTIPSGWVGTSGSPIADVEFRYAPVLRTELHSALVRSTLLRPLAPSVAGAHLYTLAKLKEIPQLEGPTFAFVHLILPHFPYVFDRNGAVRRDLAPNLHFFGDFKERMGGWGVKELYVDQLIYLNGRLIEVIDAILAASPYAPIIIVQSDHGTGSTDPDDGSGPLPRERLAILNAYFVPDAVRARLYPGITPVNSFRLVLSTLFGANSPPLPDWCFFSWYGRVYALRNVTGELAAR